MDRKQLQDLSRVRLKEASALLELGLADGAFYLAGYAVECALKACIAKGTRRGEFPDRKKVESSHSHNLLQLSRVAGLDEACIEQAARDPRFRNNWEYVQLWSEQSRYRRHRLESARALLEAVGDRSHGVISWIKQRW
ncbi:MAG: DNA-binding protein [Candidatus Solibacter sp.]|nr:DNA-binding protein [Candidatus Solibacter sp.]